MRAAGLVNFLENFTEAVAELPLGIMVLELAHVTDPPNVVTDPVVFLVSPLQLAAADGFAQVDGFEHGAVRMAAAAHVEDFTAARLEKELPESLDQIMAVDVIAHLFAAITEDAVRLPGNGAAHQVRKEAVQLGAGVRWA